LLKRTGYKSPHYALIIIIIIIIIINSFTILQDYSISDLGGYLASYLNRESVPREKQFIGTKFSCRISSLEWK